jgi:hypothetical protein
MVFHPTLEEMRDFSAYIAFMESVGAQRRGVARVVPPEGYAPRRQGYDLEGELGELIVPHPIEQCVSGNAGIYNMMNIEKKTVKLRDFAAMAESAARKPPEKLAGNIPVRVVCAHRSWLRARLPLSLARTPLTVPERSHIPLPPPASYSSTHPSLSRSWSAISGKTSPSTAPCTGPTFPAPSPTLTTRYTGDQCSV